MKIYFLAAAQHHNLGDLLINKMLIDELAKFGSVYVDAAGMPDNFKQIIFNGNVKNFEIEYGGSLKRFSAIKLLRKVKNDFEYYFMSPGPIGNNRLNLKSLIRKIVMTFEFNYLHQGKLHLNLVANDIVLNSRLDIWLEKFSSRFFDHCIVRSRENMEELKSFGFKNVDYIPDLAFLYDRVEENVENNFLYISFRDLNDKVYTQKIISILSKAIPYFIENKMQVQFIYQVKSDKLFNQHLFEQFQSKNVSFRNSRLMFNEIKIYNSAKYVITNRLHVMLLGIVHHAVPLIILNDDNKTAKINRILIDNQLSELLVESYSKIELIDSLYSKHKLEIRNIAMNNKKDCKEKINKLFQFNN